MTRLTEAQLEERRKGIGASDVGAILGLSPYQSALGLYLEKRGEVITDQTSEQTDFGDSFEDAVIKEFERRQGVTVSRPNGLTWMSQIYSYLRCTPDGIIWQESPKAEAAFEVVEAVVEAKTSMGWNRDAWEDGPPLYIEAQVQHQIMVTGAKRGYVPVYFDNRHFEIFTIERDEEMIADLIRIETEFWQRVLDGNPPEVTSRDTELLGRWFSTAVEKSVDLSAGHLGQVKRCVELGPIIKSYEDELNYLKAQLMKELGEADTGLYKGEAICTWKSQRIGGLMAKKLKESLPDIYSQFENNGSHRVLRFSWKEEK